MGQELHRKRTERRTKQERQHVLRQAVIKAALRFAHASAKIARDVFGLLVKAPKQGVVTGQRRVRPALMTTATTVLALVPVLTSTGRGSDIMVPMAIPSFGGMVFAVITMLIVPLLYSWIEERKLNDKKVDFK